MGVPNVAVFPSAASITSAGAASTSVHLPVSAPLGAGSSATTAPEETVSAVHAGVHTGKRFPTCCILGILNSEHIFIWEKSLYGI